MTYISIRNKTIPKRALLQHLDGASTVYNSSGATTQSLNGKLSVDCPAYSPVYLQDGLLKLARNTSIPAEYITLAAGVAGDTVPIANRIFISDLPDTFTRDLYLGDGVITETPNLNAPIFQKLAIKQADGYMFDVYDYYYVL